MSVLKKLAGDTALYGVSTMLGRLLNYLLVPLHTSLFLPSELAVQVQLFSFAGIALVIYTFGMETAFFRYASAESDKKKYYNVILSAVMLVSVAISTVVFAFSDAIAAIIEYPENGNLVRWFALIMATDAIVSIPFARLRLEKKALKFVTIRVSNILINIGLNLFFLVFCRDIFNGAYLSALKPAIDTFYDPAHAVDYIVLANVIANLLFIPMLWREFADFRFIFNRTLFRPVWVYAFPIMVMNLAAVTNMLFDRLFLQYLLPENFYPGRTTKDAIGIYGQCVKLSVFMNLAIQAFKYAAEPFFFSKGEDKSAPPVFAQIMKWFIIVCVIMWVGICLNLDLLAEVFLKKKIFQEGLPAVPWLLSAFLFLGIYYNLAAWFKLTNKTQYGTYLTLTGAAVVIVLNVVLVPLIGYLGCAIAFATSSFVMMALCYYYGQKYYPVPYDLRSAIQYILVGGIIIVASTFLGISDLWISVPVHMLILLLFTAGVFMMERKHLPFLRKK
ncbi:MAG TPA: polysaccharide biosynthesis C-terminal domain-containing protein [Dyadobacter sp.]|jgi:O-antigen/teichoic acid export membrane protein|nr:polysaccharide biosynthesis C-terminal domain-containing protein [Dyadobacter sp.]